MSERSPRGGGTGRGGSGPDRRRGTPASQRPQRGAGGRGADDRSQRDQSRRRGRSDQAPRRRGERPERYESTRPARSESQQRYDGPEIPDHITGRELDRNVRAQLRSLPEKLASRVMRHLAAAQELLDVDPATAHQHTLAARARAGRLAVVREAVGEAAYRAGEFAEALAELRAARRMNGAQDYLPMMADCERALGRPDRALALLRTPARERFPTALAAEAVIVEAGARLDRGETEAAVRTLERAPLQTQARDPWVARLRYAYADALLAAGRRDDALAWFHRTEAIDGDQVTDAPERIAELERSAPGD